MTTTTPVISPLRRRMIDDMRMRKLGDKTESHYIRAGRQLPLRTIARVRHPKERHLPRKSGSPQGLSHVLHQ